MTPTIAAIIVLGCLALSVVMPVVVGILTKPKEYAPAVASRTPAKDGEQRWDMTEDGWIVPHVPPAADFAVRSESTDPSCTHPNRPEPVETTDEHGDQVTIGHICPDCFGTVGVCLSCWDAENPRTIRTADDARRLLEAQKHLVDHLADRFQFDGDSVLMSVADHDRMTEAVKRVDSTAALLRAIGYAEKAGVAS